MSNEPDFIPKDPGIDQALELAGVASAAIPWIGGPLSAILSGVSFGRKIDRVKEVVNGIVADLREFRSEASEKYVQTEEFQELLEAALRRASEEKNEEKRRIYRDFVVNAICRPGESYDDKLRALRTLEELSLDHLRVLAAIAQDPPELPYSGGMGSPSQSLSRRLGGITRERLDELVADLNSRRLTNLQSLHTTMTAHGAEDLRSSITPFGRKVLEAGFKPQGVERHR
jgi:hypothetical protein